MSRTSESFPLPNQIWNSPRNSLSDPGENHAIEWSSADLVFHCSCWLFAFSENRQADIWQKNDNYELVIPRISRFHVLFFNKNKNNPVIYLLIKVIILHSHSNMIFRCPTWFLTPWDFGDFLPWKRMLESVLAVNAFWVQPTFTRLFNQARYSGNISGLIFSLSNIMSLLSNPAGLICTCSALWVVDSCDFSRDHNLSRK